MAIVADRAVVNYDEFEQAISACIDTLLRNKVALYMLAKERTTGFSITLNFYPGEVVNMDISANQLVFKNEEKNM